ncbi:MAG: terminase small subunit [Planctomycetes bacterium]|nr:terminase small subunit [Planctomycetota bacterium]
MNATQAAIRAGYSAKTARSVGAENLTKPDISAAITTAQSKREERTEVTQDMVVKELARIAFTTPSFTIIRAAFLFAVLPGSFTRTKPHTSQVSQVGHSLVPKSPVASRLP